MEHFPYGKQIDELLYKKKQTRPRPPKPIFLGQESEKSENQIRIYDFFEIYIYEMCSRNFCA